MSNSNLSSQVHNMMLQREHGTPQHDITKRPRYATALNSIFYHCDFTGYGCAFEEGGADKFVVGGPCVSLQANGVLFHFSNICFVIQVQGFNNLELR